MVWARIDLVFFDGAFVPQQGQLPKVTVDVMKKLVLKFISHRKKFLPTICGFLPIILKPDAD
jgi:hypothetical protein